VRQYVSEVFYPVSYERFFPPSGRVSRTSMNSAVYVVFFPYPRFLIFMQVYDGVRRRAFPVLFDALEPGTEDDRMKGALWTLNMSSFGKYAINGEPMIPH